MVLLAVGYVMFSRWQDNRDIEHKRAQELTEKQREQDRIAVEQLGGKEMAIIAFFASPSAIRRGQSAQLCYGVSNAKTLKIEPLGQPVWPSEYRCVDVSPEQTTTYTLTIEDGAGKTASQTVDIKVR